MEAQSRPPSALILGALLLVAAIIGALHVRGVLYANWFAVPDPCPGASTALRLDAPRQDARQGSFGLRPRTFVLAGLLILASATTFFCMRGRGEGAAGKGEEQAVTCLQLGDYAGLASLPPGLVLPDIDLGGFVLATTKHRVLLAPYHRLQKELIFARRLGAGDPAAAAEPLRRLGIDYLVDCRGTSDPVQDIPSSLRTAMMSGHAPAFLEPILADPPSRLMVWRVVK